MFTQQYCPTTATMTVPGADPTMTPVAVALATKVSLKTMQYMQISTVTTIIVQLRSSNDNSTTRTIDNALATHIIKTFMYVLVINTIRNYPIFLTNLAYFNFYYLLQLVYTGSRATSQKDTLKQNKVKFNKT